MRKAGKRRHELKFPSIPNKRYKSCEILDSRYRGMYICREVHAHIVIISGKNFRLSRVVTEATC